MPGKSVVVGEQSGQRPILKLVHFPLYDRVVVAAAATGLRVRVFTTGQVADVNAVDGTAKGKIDTSLIKGGSLEAPRAFDAIGMTINVMHAAITTSDAGPITMLNALRWRRHASFFLRVGPTIYLDEIRCDAIPCGNELDGFAGNTAGIVVRLGQARQDNQYPLRVPEEVVLPDGEHDYTGLLVPAKVLPTESFEGQINIVGAVTFDNALAVVCWLHGFLKKEK